MNNQLLFVSELLPTLDGQNRAIVIAESLARVFAAIRIASVRWRSYLPPKNTGTTPHRPCVCCAAIRVARLAFIRAVFVPRGIAEWLARVDRVRSTLAIGDFAHLSCRPTLQLQQNIFTSIKKCFWNLLNLHYIKHYITNCFGNLFLNVVVFCLRFVWREDELHYIKKLARELN